MRAAAGGTGNAVISPYSALVALGMTQYAARGDAAAALARVLGGDAETVAGRLTAVDTAVAQAVAAGDQNSSHAAGAVPGHDEPDPIEFVANRPFLYWIHDTVTGCPLFLGRVTDPTG